MLYTMIDHNQMLRACAHPMASEEEVRFLATQASLAAAQEPVPAADYRHAQALIGGGLSTTTPIFDR